jgi:23S rRNA pseudouridine2457 synthase
MARILLLHKPYGVLCQFTGAPGQRTLAECVPVPGVYAAGRLDADSEGLVVLTDDGALQHRLTDPRHAHEKTYWVQVEGEPDAAALAALRHGVLLRDGHSRPARVRRLPEPDLPPRQPPVRYRRAIPTAWLEVVLREGRNRQLRRMTAAVGHPTLRLVRVAVGPWRLGDLAPGRWCEVPPPVMPPARVSRSTPRT